jgi:hypothetical protein
MVDSLVFRIQHVHADNVCGVFGGTRGTVIVMTVAFDVQFGFPPNDFSFCLRWRRSVVLRLRPVRIRPVIVRSVLGIVVILFALVLSLALR